MRFLAVAAAVLMLVPTAVAASPPPTPADVYADYAAHGHLTKRYPKSVLEAIVNDPSLNQYGDPVLMLRLRRAAQLQLAGVAPPAAAAPPATTGGTTTSTATSTS